MALGRSTELSALRGPRTEVVDLASRMVTPGLIDGHCHPTKGAIARLFSCQFDFAAAPDDIAEALQRFLSANPDVSCVVGGRWGSSFFDTYDLPSPRAWLDALVSDRPVYLRDDSGHNGWANSETLRRVGIRRDTPDPDGGAILRGPDGEPNGLLLEAADVRARAEFPDWSEAQYRAGVLEMVRIANGYGITGVTDADATEPLLHAYRETDRAGALSLYVAASISTPYGHRDTPLDIDAVEALRDRYASARVDTRFAKIYLDGVPTSARTAAMWEPYRPHPDFPDGFCGHLHVEEEVLAKDIEALERRGFTVKLHTAGDRAVTTALNAIERAHALSGRRELRHELAHAGLITPSDLPRFAAQNVVADLSPYLWYPVPILESVRAAIGNRVDAYWPIRDLLEAGAPVIAGSDWPAAVASMDPWTGLATMVTRRDPSAVTAGTLGADQAIDLSRALQIFTLDGARALRRDHTTGSLAVGKSADLIVLDRHLFEIEARAVAETQVEATWFAGEAVYTRAGSL